MVFLCGIWLASVMAVEATNHGELGILITRGVFDMRNKVAMTLWVLTGVAGFLTWAWDLPVYAVAVIATCGGFAWLLPTSVPAFSRMMKNNWLLVLAFTLSLLTAIWAILGHSHDAFVKGMLLISVLTGLAWLGAWITGKNAAANKTTLRKESSLS